MKATADNFYDLMHQSRSEPVLKLDFRTKHSESLKAATYDMEIEPVIESSFDSEYTFESEENEEDWRPKSNRANMDYLSQK